MQKINKFFSLIRWYLPVAVVQIISGRITVGSIDPWYRSLNKASWNPPAWVFGPVWTLLYIMMTLAVWMVAWSGASKKQRRVAYALFFAQLLANGLWSILFFGLHKPGLALLDLSLLVTLVGVTAIQFYRIKPLAGYMLLPYLLWACYALSLNGAIWWLN